MERPSRGLRGDIRYHRGLNIQILISRAAHRAPSIQCGVTPQSAKIALCAPLIEGKYGSIRIYCSGRFLYYILPHPVNPDPIVVEAIQIEGAQYGIYIQQLSKSCSVFHAQTSHLGHMSQFSRTRHSRILGDSLNLCEDPRRSRITKWHQLPPGDFFHSNPTCPSWHQRTRMQDEQRKDGIIIFYTTLHKEFMTHGGNTTIQSFIYSKAQLRRQIF